jgi:hypothetical protein
MQPHAVGQFFGFRERLQWNEWPLNEDANDDVAPSGSCKNKEAWRTQFGNCIKQHCVRITGSQACIQPALQGEELLISGQQLDYSVINSSSNAELLFVFNARVRRLPRLVAPVWSKHSLSHSGSQKATQLSLEFLILETNKSRKHSL